MSVKTIAKSPKIQFSTQVTLVDICFTLSWGIYGLSGAVGEYINIEIKK